MDIKTIMTHARFWRNVKIVPYANSNQCWEWQASKLPNGYGIASIGNGDTMLAHRYVASMSQDITDNVVMHSCDNPACVRPDHLVVGTQKDNMKDMINKGRKNTKVNHTIVRDIRTRTLTRKEYAAKYNISEHTVGDIQRRYVWKHVD